MYVYIYNDMATVPGFGFGYNGQEFRYARYSSDMTDSGFSSDGLRREYEEVGWVNLGVADRDALPPRAVEALERRYAEACTAEEAERAKWNGMFQPPAQAQTPKSLDPDSEDLTIGGVTWPRWQWQEGRYCPALSDEDRAIIQREGLEASEQSDGGWYVINPRFAEFCE